VSPAMLADRAVYAAAAIDGRTAPEIEATGAAAAEVAELWRYITDRLETP
jgi:chromosome partitioning protein